MSPLVTLTNLTLWPSLAHRAAVPPADELAVVGMGPEDDDPQRLVGALPGRPGLDAGGSDSRRHERNRASPADRNARLADLVNASNQDSRRDDLESEGRCGRARPVSAPSACATSQGNIPAGVVTGVPSAGPLAVGENLAVESDP